MAPCTVGAAPVATLQPDEIYTRSAGGVTLVKAYDEEGKLMSIGSAVLIAPENLLTNCHVLAKAKRIEIKQEQSVFEAKLVYVDIERDLCQIAAQNFHATPVEIGDSDALQVGKKVYALGNPRGLELTLTDGIVSALRKDSKGMLRYIQTSTPISPGSSGGGLFDSAGKLIGITAMYRPDSQNLNFAIPINFLRDLPARSATVFAKVTESAQKIETAKTSPSKITAKTDELIVVGAQLREHFGVARIVDAIATDAASRTGTRNIHLSTKPGGGLTIAGPRLNRTEPLIGMGTWGIKDESQVCLGVTYGHFRALRGCYHLYFSEPKKFVLRSIEDGTYIEYSGR
jgi:serine protease Do